MVVLRHQGRSVRLQSRAQLNHGCGQVPDGQRDSNLGLVDPGVNHFRAVSLAFAR